MVVRLLVLSLISVFISLKASATYQFKCGIYQAEGYLEFSKSADPEKVVMPIFKIAKGTMSEVSLPILMNAEEQLDFEQQKQTVIKRNLTFRVYENSSKPKYAQLIKMEFVNKLNKKNHKINKLGEKPCKK